MPKRKVESDYVELAEELGWEWLGPYPNTVVDKTRWRCNHGHLIQRSYKRAKERGCMYCTKHWLKEERDYQLLAEIHGVTPPDILPENSREFSAWREENRVCVTTFRNLLNRRRRISDGEPVDETKIKRLKRSLSGRADRSQGSNASPA
jgi:hypothetical protein